MTKDNIMKLTDGLFHRVFMEIGKEYPDIEQEHQIIDIGTARLADTPERYDVVVTMNLYGDIISDVVAQIAGSVGLAGSANIGEGGALFEAIHGSAPDIAGQDIANPSGLLQAALMMLRHLGQHEVAQLVENAWLRTLEDGLHTADIYRADVSKERVGTKAFADAVIARLGLQPNHLRSATQPDVTAAQPSAGLSAAPAPRPQQELVGCDIFLLADGAVPDELGQQLTELAGSDLKLKIITNRGVKVYPQGHAETFCTDHWRCRFVEASMTGPDSPYRVINYPQVLALMNRLTAAGLTIIKTENLYLFDGQRGFSLGQGE
jgi:isocitrate dehydrogenase